MKRVSGPAIAKSHRSQKFQTGGVARSAAEHENQEDCMRKGPRVKSDHLQCPAPSTTVSPASTGKATESVPVDSGRRRKNAALPVASGPRRSLATVQPAADSPAILVGNNRQPRSTPVRSFCTGALASRSGRAVLEKSERTQARCHPDAGTPADSPERVAAAAVMRQRPEQHRQPAAITVLPSGGSRRSIPEQPTSTAAAQYEYMFADESLASWEARAKKLSEEIEALLVENNMLRKENTDLNKKLESLDKQQEEETLLYSLMEELVDYADYFDGTLQAVKRFANTELGRMEEPHTP